MDPLQPGRIIWKVYPGDRGGGKPRPMVVVTRRTDILRTKQVFLVVCSTLFQEPLEDHEVVIPHDRRRPCVTKLKEPTVAVRNWTVTFRLDEITETGGLVPTPILREICKKLGIQFQSER